MKYLNGKVYRFKDYRERIFDQLPKSTNTEFIEHFINLPILDVIDDRLQVGGSFIPTVALMNKETGQLHFYAIKQLIDLEGE